jgi:hypothetical protein
MVTINNSNDEIPPDTDWEFQSKNGGLYCFKITYIILNARLGFFYYKINTYYCIIFG